jgi:hypothetical protein
VAGDLCDHPRSTARPDAVAMIDGTCPGSTLPTFGRGRLG